MRQLPWRVAITATFKLKLRDPKSKVKVSDESTGPIAKIYYDFFDEPVKVASAQHQYKYAHLAEKSIRWLQGL